jgi:Cu/Ag efflux protein CusF
MKAIACVAVLALVTPFVFAQDKSAMKVQPVAAAGETIKTSAKVTAIDQATRTVTLQEANGHETVLKVGPDVRNLAQVKVGDVVNAEYQLAAVVSLKKGAGVRSATESTSTARAKAGEKPAGVIVKEGTITADVIGIDAAKGTVSVKGPAGRVVHGKVNDKALLKDIKIGDQVELDYVSSLAIQVVPGPAPGQAKK